MWQLANDRIRERLVSLGGCIKNFSMFGVFNLYIENYAVVEVNYLECYTGGDFTPGFFPLLHSCPCL